MADRVDYYYRQPVTEAELDRGFELLEAADHSMIVDQGLTGIVSGLGVSENSPVDLFVAVAAGVAYSKNGERIELPAAEDVDLSVDDAAASTAVASGGNERWVSLFVVPDRDLSDPRIDGNSLTVYFERAESYGFSVVAGAEASLGTSTKPSLDPDKILLCDVLLTFGKTTILNADVNTDRREARTIPLSASLYGGGPDWADGTTNPSTTTEAQLDKIVSDLGQSTAGSNRILSAAQAGAPVALTQGSIQSQLGELLAAVNAHRNSSSAHTPANVGAVALAAADTITAIKTLGVGGLLSGSASRATDSALIEDLRTVSSDAGLILETNSYLAGAKNRIYVGRAGRNGWTFAMNAAWNPATNQWTSDVAGAAFKFVVGDTVNRLSMSYKLAGSPGETWADSAAGWDVYEGATMDLDATSSSLGLTQEGQVTLGQAGDGAPSSVDPGSLYRQNIPKAWAHVRTDGAGNVYVDQGFRVGSVSLQGAGATSRVRVNFSPFMSAVDEFIVLATNLDGSDLMLWTADTGLSTQYTELACYNVSGGARVDLATDVRRVGVLVFGRD